MVAQQDMFATPPPAPPSQGSTRGRGSARENPLENRTHFL